MVVRTEYAYFKVQRYQTKTKIDEKDSMKSKRERRTKHSRKKKKTELRKKRRKELIFLR